MTHSVDLKVSTVCGGADGLAAAAAPLTGPEPFAPFGFS